MKQIIIVLIAFIAHSNMVFGQDQNPFIQNATITPAPLLPLEFNGAGEISFEVGNSGIDELPLVTNQEMTLVLTLSNGIPNDVNPLDAIAGSASTWFDWSYDSGTKTYSATQNKLIAGLDMGNVTIQYAVDKNTPITLPSNGFNINLQPPPYSNGSNTTADDADSDYTYVEATDYGDAPLSYGEAAHELNLIKSGAGNYTEYIYLGGSVDPDTDYNASLDANGDDLNGTDDEDGVTFPATMMTGTEVTIPIEITSEDGSTGFLRGWIDWNADGVFTGTGEQVIAFLPVGASTTYPLVLTVPIDAEVGFTFARFRVGSLAGNSPTTPDTYGEVEDYQIEIIPAAPALEVRKTDVLADTDGSGTDTPGDIITYTITVENTGTIALTNIEVTDKGVTFVGSNLIPSLAVGATAEITATYAINQNDIDAGQYSNQASALGDSPNGPNDVSDTLSDDPDDLTTNTEDPTITPLTSSHSLSVIKYETGRSVVVGEFITYDIVVINTGNVTVSNIDVTDANATILAGSPILSLAPGLSATVTAEHEITQADIDAGFVENTASAIGDSPSGTPNDVSDMMSDTGTYLDGSLISDPESVQTPNGDGTIGSPELDDDPTVTPLFPPDVTPVITASPNVMNGVTSFNIFIEITELNQVNTNGLIEVRVPKDIRWTFDGLYDETLISLGGIELNNSDWTYTEKEDNHLFSFSTVIPSGSFSMIGFKAIWDAGQTQGAYTITSQIQEGSGSENRIDNNVDAEKVDYFID